MNMQDFLNLGRTRYRYNTVKVCVTSLTVRNLIVPSGIWLFTQQYPAGVYLFY